MVPRSASTVEKLVIACSTYCAVRWAVFVRSNATKAPAPSGSVPAVGSILPPAAYAPEAVATVDFSVNLPPDVLVVTSIAAALALNRLTPSKLAPSSAVLISETMAVKSAFSLVAVSLPVGAS
ncbi:hypothetical protein D3C80_1717570 [compost metagenome]